jgi:hypothetical protein
MQYCINKNLHSFQIASLIESQTDRCGGYELCDQSVLQRDLVDTVFRLPTGETVCLQKAAHFASFVRQNVGQTVGYDIGIAAEFIRQLLNTSSI